MDIYHPISGSIVTPFKQGLAMPDSKRVGVNLRSMIPKTEAGHFTTVGRKYALKNQLLEQNLLISAKSSVPIENEVETKEAFGRNNHWGNDKKNGSFWGWLFDFNFPMIVKRVGADY